MISIDRLSIEYERGVVHIRIEALARQIDVDMGGKHSEITQRLQAAINAAFAYIKPPTTEQVIESIGPRKIEL